MRSRNKIHLSANIIIRLMYELSKLVIIMGRYLGIYAKDSLDELLLITHPSSLYKGNTRRVERSAVKEYINGLSKYEDSSDGSEKEWAEDFPYEVTEDDTKWNERSETEGLEYEASSPNGDNFPYIRGHKPWV